MEDLDKKTNLELQGLEKELRDKFEEVRLEVVKVYDYWQSIGVNHNLVDNELKNRGLKL
tara:strand:- start:769 stop:945 length:177 start_codon:yes stop_codon:yes gene_type:complete